MYNFICENGHDNLYAEKAKPPDSCCTCSVAFEEERVIEVETLNEPEIIGLTLIYQKDQQQSIDIPRCDKAILGREHIGADVFSNIRINGEWVISRIHCSIEFKNGNFYLQDHSLNGTFLGIDKINCKDSPGRIEDGGLIFLGREPFIVKVNRRKIEKDKSSGDCVNKPDKIIETKTLFRCNESTCGYESISFIPVCPRCNTYNSLIRI